MRWLVTLAVAFALSEVARADDPTAEAVDRVVADAMTAFRVPGVAVVVVRGDQTLVLKGYGKRAVDAPDAVTADTVFPLASCTKQFTTALLAMLVDDGKLGWDDPVRDLLPAFGLSNPHANALLTVRDLVTHRTGLGAHDLLWYRAPWTLDHTLEQVKHLPLDYPFRGGYRYSSVPFVAAGRVAAKAGGRKWEELVRDRLTEPLDMRGAAFAPADVPADADRARGHRLTADGKVERMPAFEPREPNPAGSMSATPRDLVAWLQFHLADGVAPSGKRLVSAKHLVETRTPQNLMRLEGGSKAMFPDTVQASYAMGWVVTDHRGLKVVGHGGLIDGFRLQLTLVPEKELGFAVLANLHDTRLPIALTNALIDRYGGLKPRDWNAYYAKLADDEAEAKRTARAARDKARDPSAKPAFPVAEYAGTYEHPAYGTATVTHAGGKLAVKFSGFACPLEHFAGDAFRVTEGFFDGELATFTAADGKATTLTLAGIAFARK